MYFDAVITLYKFYIKIPVEGVIPEVTKKGKNNNKSLGCSGYKRTRTSFPRGFIIIILFLFIYSSYLKT